MSSRQAAAQLLELRAKAPIEDQPAHAGHGSAEQRAVQLQVELEEAVDPALLGGAIASVAGLVFDGSLRTQLAQLRTSLTRGQ